MLQLSHESRNRHTEFVTQLPFEIKTSIPPTDRGKRGYSDELATNLKGSLAITGSNPFPGGIKP
jgi:hypothetical protein